jgi:hypothetical protein
MDRFITFLRRWGRFTVSPAKETNSTIFSSAKSLFSFTSQIFYSHPRGKSNNPILFYPEPAETESEQTY